MIIKRQLTKEEFDYFTELKVMTMFKIQAHDFRRMTSIVNDCTNLRLSAQIGCSSCLSGLLQVATKLYKTYQDEHEQKPQGETQGSIEQNDSGDKGGVSEVTGDESPKAEQVVRKRRRGRPSKSN